MSEDLSHVPRRLRRFYRHGQAVPEELAHPPESPASPSRLSSRAPSKNLFGANPAPTPSSSEMNEGDFHEPWMDASPGKITPLQSAPTPPKPLPRREQRKMENPSSSSPIPGSPSPPQGLFSRILQAGSPKPTPMDHALGLQNRQSFEDHLPRTGEKILNPPQGSPSSSSKSEMETTLNELKRLAATNASTPPAPPVTPTSFHFTPVSGAPNPVTPAVPGSNQPAALTPKQRVEMRRMRDGSTAFGAAGGEDTQSPPPSTAPAPNAAPIPAHIRRRMGQVVSSSESTNESEEPASPESSTPAEEDEDFKSLMGGPDKKKKAKKPSNDEDEDFSLDEDLDADIAPLDDEK